jgi:hypothetical protein
MIASQDRLQPMDERRLPHQDARHSTVDQGYPSDGIFLFLHLWAPSKWNERLSTPSSRICAMVMRISYANSLWVFADTPLENCTQPRCPV